MITLENSSCLDLKPTRRITKSYCSITGKKPSRKTGNSHRFESALERDYISLLEFDERVEWYVEQPFTISYSYNGKVRIYTPDFLVIYKPSVDAIPLLAEVKYKADLKRHEAEYQPKFEAAIEFAHEKGYQFSVITEEEIRTGGLQNAVFLNRYLHGDVDAECATILMTCLSDLQYSTPEALLTYCSNTANNKSELLYVLWQLIARRTVCCDLIVPITMNSKIWINPSLR
ncbi:TnsA endonuclease N-terminal domain-containing protein [Paraflavisolibacter sp. H34]|uniref:TnsA endonuclease N-terminal domain-containing protein n=1 Tax=Huijunlia imazamoxiresistens TaxID=3127457 RepID=UPI003016FCBA